MSQNKVDQMKRKWLLFMILGPGIFFLVYWLAVQPGKELQVDRIKPPEEYHLLEQTATTDGNTYLVKTGDKIFNNEMSLKNNLAVAEPGYVFMGLGMKVNNLETKPAARVVDSEGRQYQPLQVDQSIVAQNFGLTEKESFLYLFKVNSHADFYYFQVENNASLTWRIPSHSPR